MIEPVGCSPTQPEHPAKVDPGLQGARPALAGFGVDGLGGAIGDRALAKRALPGPTASIFRWDMNGLRTD